MSLQKSEAQTNEHLLTLEKLQQTSLKINNK